MVVAEWVCVLGFWIERLRERWFKGLDGWVQQQNADSTCSVEDGQSRLQGLVESVRNPVIGLERVMRGETEPTATLWEVKKKFVLNRVENNDILPTSTVGTHINISAQYVGQLQVVI